MQGRGGSLCDGTSSPAPPGHAAQKTLRLLQDQSGDRRVQRNRAVLQRRAPLPRPPPGRVPPGATVDTINTTTVACDDYK